MLTIFVIFIVKNNIKLIKNKKLVDLSPQENKFSF